MTQSWGLLWFDDNPKRTWPQKIALAAAHYEEKFEMPVGEVHIHVTKGDGAPTDWDRPDGVRVPVYWDAQPCDHLFLCQAPKKKAQEQVAETETC